jgi:Skp family chaperone for outer membrane proteins
MQSCWSNEIMDRLRAQWAPLALAVIVVVGVAATARQAGQGIAVVNLQIIMPQTPGYQEAQATFEAEFQPANDDFEASAVLSQTARLEKETEIQELQARLEQRATDLQNRQAERERELMDPLEQRVRSVLEGIRAERNLAIIFDVATMPGLAAVDQSIDLTALVVQRLLQ